ncbi:His Kinase A (phospho-acceptor) domain-containing protein [Cellulophaga fucicola]|uniref:histidine kinase n=2 Tax=Cellulophaga fucicola TaxID=76595 RepID=A0A1K1PNH5_9FLAO|nr:His Kinase A (phospho-acceptor) domain-containing protein [Cellulophaga fucicola]
MASVLIAGVTIYQYREQSKEYNRDRLDRKEAQIKESVNLTIRKTSFERITEKLHLIFKEEIFEIAEIQNVNFSIYDLEGQLIIDSHPLLNKTSIVTCLDALVLQKLKTSNNQRYVEEVNHIEKTSNEEKVFRSSYTFIKDLKFRDIGILKLEYVEDTSFEDKELPEFLLRLGLVYIFMFVIAIVLAYFTSKYITRSLKTISDKLNQTDLSIRNPKILIDNPSEEIGRLVDAYNRMIDELEQSAVKLAKSEREQAWREMAKQVAHEIKNPLTPMRLSVQSFERKFNPEDPEIKQKLAEYSKTLIQQIDTMSSIASAFSNFAQMPAQQNETLNVVKIVKLAVDIFNESYIHFIAEEEHIVAKLDRTQLVRVVTNLVKNAMQAVPEVENPRVLVTVASDGDFVKISVADNGVGIADEFKDKVFEPKFTTKTSGMGLGLGMVKNIVETYKGDITLTSQPDKGTVFVVRFPKENK